MTGYYPGHGFEDHYDEDDDPPPRDRATVYLARVLAEAAGTPWDQMTSYPGHARNRWYELAQRTIDKLDAWRGARDVLRRA